MIRGMLLIARRELVERGRSRVFLGVMVATTLVILVALWGVSRMGTPGASAEVTIGGAHPASLPGTVMVVGDSFGVDVAVGTTSTAAAARSLVVEGVVDAALVDGDTILTVGPANPVLVSILRTAAAAAAREQVAAGLGLDAQDLAALLDPVDVQVLDVSPDGPVDEARIARGIAAFVSVLVLFMALLVFGQFVGMGVVEEKQNRVAEVVLARVPTAAMLGGKVLGIGALGLVQLVSIGVATMVGLRLFPPDVPGLDLAQLGVTAIAWMVLWFVLGFLMYSVVYATLGATVSRQEDLQSLAYLPSLLLMPAYLLVALALGGPGSPWLVPMSLVPVWAPLLMPFRIVTDGAAAWEIVVAIVGSAAFVVLLMWVASRVYRGAALRSGGRVSFREAWRSG